MKIDIVQNIALSSNEVKDNWELCSLYEKIYLAYLVLIYLKKF
ncbi:MAG: hypothetical protein AB1304_01880 [Bacteroidota bacterium]